MMNQILRKPYKSLWLAVPMILGLSIIGFDRTIDIQMYDTYFVISSIHIGIFFSIILGIIGFIYWLIRNKRLVNWMTAFHVLATISTLVLVVLTGLLFKKAIQGDFETFGTVNQIMFAIILMAILSQLVFVTNLVLSLMGNKQKN